VSQRGTLIEAALWLTFVTVAVRVLPFRRLATFLGGHGQESSMAIDAAGRARARIVGQALRAARRRLPFHPSCLILAVAAMAMLRRRRQASTLYFGVADGGTEELRAHAWLRSGDVMVTGGPGRHGCVVVRQFTKPGTG
jgi:hypothetical protein